MVHIPVNENLVSARIYNANTFLKNHIILEHDARSTRKTTCYDVISYHTCSHEL